MKDIKISLKDFASHVDWINDGHDRDVVFHYLEDYLKSELEMEDIDIKNLARDVNYEEEE